MILRYVDPLFGELRATDILAVAYRIGVQPRVVLRWIVRANPLHWVIA